MFDETSLGSSYILASFGNSIGEGGQFSVQATEDDTEFTFVLPDGQSATIALDAGETFKFATGDIFGNNALGLSLFTGFDLTGTTVTGGGVQRSYLHECRVWSM